MELSFEQREGLIPVPRQLALGEIDQSVKVQLWYVVNAFIDDQTESNSFGLPALSQHLRGLAQQHFVVVEHGYIDDFKPYPDMVKASWKRFFAPDVTYGKTLGFTEWLVRQDRGRARIAAAIEKVLKQTHSAYRLINNDTIVAIASEEEAAAFTSALSNLENNSQIGPKKHLLAAASHLSQGQFASSVRESIHTIEGLVRQITGESKFSKAINKLASERNLHEAFKSGILSLYGYTSDEQGIRHPLLDKGDPNVTERDALFMLGICASFATYLNSP